MKQRVSITIDDKKLRIIEELIKQSSRFRSKSHFIECSLDKMLTEEIKNE